MFLLRFWLLSLLIAFICETPAHCKQSNCRDTCCQFVDNFPARLKELRTSFAKIKEYYEANDDLETALLDEDILHDFQSPFGCHAMNEVLRFYLDTVLPTAVKEVHQDYTKSIHNIGNIFYSLKREVLNCRNYFSCKKPFEIDSVMDEYKKMQGKGLYKAMGELDLLFNYIEEYMLSKRH